MARHFDVRAFDAGTPLSPATVNLETLENYITRWARNPDPGSFFAKFNRFIRWLPDWLYIAFLRRKGYGGHILFKDGSPIGHVFYQRHGNEIHMFSIEVEEQYRGLGYGHGLMRSFLLEMSDRTEIDVLRISAGGSEDVRRMWIRTLDGKYDLPYAVEPYWKPGDGWVRIVR